MCVCVYVRMFVRMYVCGYVQMCVRVCVCMHACMDACMYVCMHIRMHVHMYVCTYLRLYACMYVYLYAYMYVCMHVCIYVCMFACLYVSANQDRGKAHDAPRPIKRGQYISCLFYRHTLVHGEFSLVSHPCVTFSSLFLLYVYIGLLPPCLILVFPPSIGLSMLSDARLLLIIHLPFSLSLYATFRSACSSLCFLRTLNRARSLFYLLLTLIVCTNSVSLSLCHSHSLLTMIVAISCIYPCLITMHVADVQLAADRCIVCSFVCLSLFPSFSLCWLWQQ